MNEPILEPFFRFLRRRKILPFVNAGSKILDIGCGAKGSLLYALSPYIESGIGIDKRAQSRHDGNLEIKECFFDGAMLPFSNDSFDCVTMLAVLEHLEHREKILNEAYRILKPGGILLITVPTWAAKPVLEFLSLRIGVVSSEEVMDHKTYFWQEDLRCVLTNTGFTNERISVRYFEFGFNLFATAIK